MSTRKNPRGDEAVWQAGNTRTKKKKAPQLEGRNVQDAYFKKTIAEDKKPVLFQFSGNSTVLFFSLCSSSVIIYCRRYQKSCKWTFDMSAGRAS